MDIFLFDSPQFLIHMYALMSMHYPVIQNGITGIECFIGRHIHTCIHICIHVNMYVCMFLLVYVWLIPTLREVEECSLHLEQQVKVK